MLHGFSARGDLLHGGEARASVRHGGRLKSTFTGRATHIRHTQPASVRGRTAPRAWRLPTPSWAAPHGSPVNLDVHESATPINGCDRVPTSVFGESGWRVEAGWSGTMGHVSPVITVSGAKAPEEI